MNEPRGLFVLKWAPPFVSFSRSLYWESILFKGIRLLYLENVDTGSEITAMAM